ncbi:hypothetical protein DQ04_27031000, partial [Trypanosoma grayi]|uniref:hypothetical protein n=1 Tax=Trypanosoma grayi TaxID=71804 RepID=UPI0004F45F59
PESGDTVLFLPASAGQGSGSTEASHHVGSAFVRRMLARVDLFASPATLAAQRLNAQLQTSMRDWRSGVVGTSITPATRNSQQRQQQQPQPQPQPQQQKHQKERSGNAPSG